MSPMSVERRQCYVTCKYPIKFLLYGRRMVQPGDGVSSCSEIEALTGCTHVARAGPHSRLSGSGDGLSSVPSRTHLAAEHRRALSKIVLPEIALSKSPDTRQWRDRSGSGQPSLTPETIDLSSRCYHDVSFLSLFFC